MLYEVAEKIAPNVDLKEVTIIRRHEIPSIHSVVVDGVEHNLGIHKDFKKNQNLAQFIPNLAKLSMSWVRLAPNEILDTHQHPIESMVIVTSGEVRLIGDKTDILQAGDIVAIPRMNKHGFIGSGIDGFWGLSIQFEHRGLYENVESPLVGFIDDKKIFFDNLIEDNTRYVETFNENELFKLMRSGKLNNPKLRDKFFDYFQVFSNYFQRMMMNRVCFTDNALYLSIFELHLDEEFGHNTKLKEDRNKRAPTWDPVLEATSAWFATKMLSLDNLEKIVLVHLVVETSACTFYKNAKKIMELDSVKSKHFEIHISDIDHVHANLGIEHLQSSNQHDFENFSAIQKQGWEMLNAAFSRIAYLVAEDK